MIRSASKSVGSREKSQGRKSAYPGFIFRKSGRTRYATEIPIALESVQCMQAITGMVCDIWEVLIPWIELHGCRDAFHDFYSYSFHE